MNEHLLKCVHFHKESIKGNVEQRIETIWKKYDEKNKAATKFLNFFKSGSSDPPPGNSFSNDEK